MNDDQLEALLERLEAGLARDVQYQLDQVAAEFARNVNRSTELTAAAFSVSRIRDMWNRRIPRIMDSLRGIFRRGADVTADDLNGRRPADRALRAAAEAYEAAVTPLLQAVGDNLASAAVQALQDGVQNGDSPERLRARLVAVFDDTGTQLGPVRSQRIAATESTRAFNAGVQAAAEQLSGPDRPLVKQWITRRDERVRAAHRDANGQLQLLGDPFDVGGTPMMFPGDPSAPLALTVNCRCIMRATPARERTASMDPDIVAELASRMPPQLKRYWLVGPGAAKIRWGTPGDFDRCVRALRGKFPEDTEGLCANLHHEALGKWPGQEADGDTTGYSGAMVALMPSEADAARLAAFSDEPQDQLHTTLFYLGEAADWSPADRADVLSAMQDAAGYLSPVQAKAFGVALWNPHDGNPCWVWNIGDHPDAGPQKLHDVHNEIRFQLEDRYADSLPDQHSPWMPHMAIKYGDGSPGEYDGGCGPITFDRLRVGFGGEYTDFPLTDVPEAVPVEPDDFEEPFGPEVAGWSTPGDTAIAFENQQTGDGRVFAPGALYWDGDGPWPLMANENFDGHDDASLAGCIEAMYRDGDRIGAEGLLYLSQDAGEEAAMLLAQDAPLGVSVDLDDVDLEVVDMNDQGGTPIGDEPPVPYRGRLLRASVLPVEGGGFHLSGETAPEMTAGGTGMVLESRRVSLFVGPDGTVPIAAFEIEAAAGDLGTGGTVVDTQKSGDYLLRITRARVRGATLVTIPAYANAKIVLNDPAPYGGEVMAAGWDGDKSTPATSDYDRVLRHVRSSKGPVGAARVAQYLKIPIMAAQRMLAKAASRGEVVRLTRGLYTDSTTSAKADHVMTDDMLASGELVASVTGRVDLPVAGRDVPWDGPGAAGRVFTWADGDTSKLDQAFAYRDDSKDPRNRNSRKLGYADVIDGELTIVPRGVFAAQAALEGSRGGVDIPADEVSKVRDRLAAVRTHVDEETGGKQMDEMQSSAWAAMADLPAMPAAWFREPTEEELPAGSGGVHYSNGRIYGWVARANEPHAGFAKRVVINDLGRIDTTHFLRQRFNLDDGTTVKAGAFTMNAGHHRDGAECETSACQFDDTRTVAGIVTVGMNERGMWFSGAAAPWMSEWDRSVFMACQPSYHMKQAQNGQWQLRAVLSVPVPGHSSPLLASAVIERSQMALTAAALMVETEAAVADHQHAERQRAIADEISAIGQSIDYDRLADALVASMARAEQRRAEEAAELEALLSEGRTMDAETTGTEGN